MGDRLCVVVSDGGARMQVADWACDAGCFANNPNPDLSEDYRTIDDVENVDAYLEDEDATGRVLPVPPPQPLACRARLAL